MILKARTKYYVHCMFFIISNFPLLIEGLLLSNSALKIRRGCNVQWTILELIGPRYVIIIFSPLAVCFGFHPRWDRVAVHDEMIRYGNDDDDDDDDDDQLVAALLHPGT